MGHHKCCTENLLVLAIDVIYQSLQSNSIVYHLSFIRKGLRYHHGNKVIKDLFSLPVDMIAIQ